MSNPSISATDSSIPMDPAETSYEQEREQLGAAYTLLAQHQVATLDGVPDAERLAVKEYIGKIDLATRMGELVVLGALGANRFKPALRYSQQDGQVYRGYADPDDPHGVIPTAIANQEGRASELESKAAQDEAAAIVARVITATQVPPRPMGASDARIASLKADLTQLLDSEPRWRVEGKVIELIQRGVAEKNFTMLHTLLGPDMALVRERMGLSDVQLLTACFQARMAAVNNDPHAIAAPPAAAFLLQQLTPETALGSVAQAAARRLRHAVGYTRRRARQLL